jgi:leucyl aminopeptidase
MGCTVYNEKEIARMKMGLLTAVSRGSSNPARLVVLRYRGDAKSRRSIALVGKGITFDSGGLNLKSSGNIEGMRSDMAGAAACLCAIRAAAELGLRRNITVVIPLAENMPGSRSYKPGDVYRAYNGKTVEIGNTDAEGRLVLADALAYTVDRLKPDMVIDIATLTGACIVCLGEIVAGYLTSDDRLSEMLFSAGEKTGERLWRLPLYREYAEDIKSDFADMNNVAPGRKAGTIIGAVFLKNFVGKTPWAHIDIAGTSWFSKKRGYRPRYATGYGVRLFIELLKNLDV